MSRFLFNRCPVRSFYAQNHFDDCFHIICVRNHIVDICLCKVLLMLVLVSLPLLDDLFVTIHALKYNSKP